MELARGALVSGRSGEAIQICDRVLIRQQQNAEALHIKGLALRAQNDLESAADLIARAAKAAPKRADIHYNLGITLTGAGQLEAAESAYRCAIQLDDGNANYHNNLGSLLSRLGRPEEAIECFATALSIDETHVQALSNKGSALLDLDCPEEAAAVLERAIKLAPEYADGFSNLGNAYVAMGDSSRGIETYGAAIKLRPGAAVFHYNLGNALLDTGQIQSAMASYRKSLALNPEQPHLRSNLLYCSLYDVEANLQSLKQMHKTWAMGHVKQPTESLHSHTFEPDKRLRLGFISADFGQHPIGYFTVLPIENLDRGQTEIFCYSERANSDHMTKRIKAASDKWIDCRNTGDAELAACIRDDGIDVLFDISGLSRGNRLGVFALKPAPLQVNWTIGYPSTTGITAMDAILSDSRHIPPGDETEFEESLAFLPNGHFCFDPPADAPDVQPLPAKANGFVTFGSFNQPRKTNSHVLDAWARILAEVPHSRLLLAYAGMDDSANRKRIEDNLGECATRVEILGRVNRHEVLARYNRIDIGLDTFPYSGGL
ncbi:MAG: tetratricopeptide repeat protein, partial [Pseudomonadota bacterium]|nr:tetratricopeptide repeat protein [Pseudomonadota bacterium]